MYCGKQGRCINTTCTSMKDIVVSPMLLDLAHKYESPIIEDCLHFVNFLNLQ